MTPEELLALSQIISFVIGGLSAACFSLAVNLGVNQ